MRILVLGLDNAGKTTIVRKFCGEDINTIEPTLGFNIKTIFHRNYSLNIWDVGGQRTIRAYWRNYFEQTDGLIWVIDSSDQARMDTCKNELLNLLQQEKLMGASLLIFANKQDLDGASSLEEIKDAFGLDTEVKFEKRHWSIIPCSAVTGDGLVNGIDWIVDDIANRIFMLN